jgi:carbonic anhydrase
MKHASSSVIQMLDAQPAMTPEEAHRALIKGNARFVRGELENLGHSLQLLRRHAAEGQAPFACVLSCADSRVPVELVFDQTIGQLFVVRVAGNFITPEILASLEYGAAILGTKVILILGHSSCGAVTATMNGQEVPGHIGDLFRYIEPALKTANGSLEMAVKENARLQRERLLEMSALLAKMVSEGNLKVESAYYDIPTGRVSMLTK